MVTEPPAIEFPCEYPIKVIADNDPGIRDLVMGVVGEHVEEWLHESVSVRNSRAGNYCSVRVSIIATGEGQLRALHQALLNQRPVRLVL